MSDIKRSLITFAKAQGSAIVATVVDFAVTIVLADWCGMYYFYATAIGAVCGGVTNCIINYKCVFEDAHQKKCFVACKYFVVWIGSILLNSYGTYALTELTHADFLIPKVVVAVLVAVLWNYQLQRCYVYRNCHIVK